MRYTVNGKAFEDVIDPGCKSFTHALASDHAVIEITEIAGGRFIMQVGGQTFTYNVPQTDFVIVGAVEPVKKDKSGEACPASGNSKILPRPPL